MHLRTAAACLLGLLAAAPLVGAGTTFTSNGHSVAFADVSGNEWWVQAHLSGAGASTVTKVEAQQTGTTTWTNLPKQSYGDWAASLHVIPGNQVRFRASWADGTQVVSCWFDHPSGVERCGVPAAGWNGRPLGTTQSVFVLQLSVGDADHDGRNEVYAVGGSLHDGNGTGLEQMRWDGTQWRMAQVPMAGNGTALAVGDGDNDGQAELYVGVDHTLQRISWTGTAWTATVISAFPGQVLDGVTLGDVDHDGRREVYYSTRVMQGGFPEVTNVSMVQWTGSAWATTRVAQFDGSSLGVWFGDGDHDGSPELYVNTDRQVGEVRWTGSAWESSYVTTGAVSMVAGDGDRDGLGEVYFIPYGGPSWVPAIDAMTKTSNGWVEHTVVDYSSGSNAPGQLFLGDGDNDGSQELYVATQNGSIEQVRWDGSAWARTMVAGPTLGPDTKIVLGDADGDRLTDIYASRNYGACGPGQLCGQGYEEFANHAFPGPSAGAFTAAFTGVRGNEWWIQANVAARGGTLAKVDVRLGTGAWQPLTLQSWGGWAASDHAPQGTVVQLRATSTTGATSLSPCYQWVPPSGADASQTVCPGTPPPPPPPPPPPGNFTASWSHVAGNQYWVEAVVTASTPVQSVVVHVNCQAAGVGMTYHADWGKWATGSVNIPVGAKVTMVATGSTGSASSGGYVWPNATPTSGC